MGVSGQRYALAAIYPQGKDPRYHCTGGWVGLRAGMDTEDRGKNPYASSGDRTSIARLSSRLSDIILTELPRLRNLISSSVI
jgi:hypothetical protein